MGVVLANVSALINHVNKTNETMNSFVKQIKKAHSKSAHVRFECKAIDVITIVNDVMKMMTSINKETNKMKNVLGELRDRDNKYWVNSVCVKSDPS